MKSDLSYVAGMLATIGSRPCQFGVFFKSWITLLLFCFAISFQAKAEDLHFANLVNTGMTFGGGSFNFTSTNGYQFAITGVTGGTGDAQGLQGYISPGGPFMIGSISSFNDPILGLVHRLPQ